MRAEAEQDLASLAPTPPAADEPVHVQVPVRRDLTTGTVAEVPGLAEHSELTSKGIGVSAIAVSAAGDVVTSYPGSMVLGAGGRYSLPVPVEPATAYPAAISDDGLTVAGTAQDLPVVWHCQRSGR